MDIPPRRFADEAAELLEAAGDVAGRSWVWALVVGLQLACSASRGVALTPKVKTCKGEANQPRQLNERVVALFLGRRFGPTRFDAVIVDA